MIFHSIVDITETAKFYLIEMLKDNKIDVTRLSMSFPEFGHILKYYDFKLSEFIHNATSMINIARRLYVESKKDRKFVALKIKSDPYSALGFLAINNLNADPDELIWDKFGIKKVLKYIPDYEGISRKHMFSVDDN
jgi:hypothetical protein